MVVSSGVERAPGAMVQWVAVGGGGKREKGRKEKWGERKKGDVFKCPHSRLTDGKSIN